MKKSTPFKIAAGVAVIPIAYIALGFFGIAGIKNVFPQNADIALTISGDQLIISAESGNLGNCKPPREIGCVQVSKSRKAHIKYRLVNMNDWKFNRMQLVAEPSAKLDFGKQAGFISEMRNDFYVSIKGKKVHPDENGIIELAGLKKGGEFKLIDLNEYPPEGVHIPQIYHYQIEACKGDCEDACEDDNCKWTDPKIENEGDN